MEKMLEFKKQLKEYKDIIELELEKYINRESCPENMLNRSIEYSLLAGGKRIRPSLMIATYCLFKNDIKECLPFAVAVEMIHNASLIHDDLPGIDNDDFRHGKLTNHKKFNEATAILAGDALINNAYKCISNELINTKNIMKKVQAFSELSTATERMICGEYVDTEFEGKEISNDYLEYMHKNKTGALIKASVRIGAILGEASQEDLEKLTAYSDKIGLTFQIKDDILSEIGDEKITGKPVGNDRKNEKVTFVTKYGLEKSQKMLENLTNEATKLVNDYNSEFLSQIAIYIKDREK